MLSLFHFLYMDNSSNSKIIIIITVIILTTHNNNNKIMEITTTIRIKWVELVLILNCSLICSQFKQVAMYLRMLILNHSKMEEMVIYKSLKIIYY